MARRSGQTPKCVEEKRRQLPIYQHYTLSPGKTKSHHPEAKCVHCHKEFVCGSKQRLIRHVRKCNSIANPEQIIAETLNTLARNSATGQLNHSILEASNLLPSQISQIQHSATQQLVGQAINPAANPPTVTTANSIRSNGNHHGSSLGNGGAGGDHVAMASSSNGLANSSNVKRKVHKRGRKPGTQNSHGPGIHVTTGMDGKTHFLPASQLPQSSVHSPAPQMIVTQAHNGPVAVGQLSYSYQAAIGSNTGPSNTATGAHINAPHSGHLPCATPNHHSSPFKLNSELMDKAYLKLVLTRNLPLSLCDTKEFQAWVKTFANDYKPPSSINLIALNLKNEAQVARYRASNILAKAPKKTVNLELHYWPDEIRGHSWYALVAGVDSKRFLVSVKDLQSTTRASDNVSADKLLNQFINENIKRVGSDRINSLMLTGRKDADTIVNRARQSLYTSHPSIVTYHCWWHFTNLLCSDIIDTDETLGTVLRNSNLLVQFINRRPQLRANLEKFSPFAGASGTLYRKKDIDRWYTHLVSYLLEYLKNNREAIQQSLENYPFKKFPSDSNNNSSTSPSSSSSSVDNSQSNAQQNQSSGTQQPSINTTHGSHLDDPQAIEVKSIVISSEYWSNLNSALVYLRSFRDIVALAPVTSSSSSSNGQINCNSNAHANTTANTNSNVQVTPVISPITSNNLSLSDYMGWCLKYGKSLVTNWKHSPDSIKQQLLGSYIQRLNSSINEFKLPFAAYLLNPKHRCAFMTQKAKDSAIEEILNIASEFMPEQSDGHTIFDQWKLYLVREEPYDMVFDESKSSPLEWWMSLPCAESIRRVALRILRLKAFSSPRPETLFAPLYFYEDETRTTLPESSYEDLALLRYFYDHEDKIGLTSNHHMHNSYPMNNLSDRSQVGYVHGSYSAEIDEPTKLIPSEPLDGAYNKPNGDHHVTSDEPMVIDGFEEITGGGYSMGNNVHMNDTSNPDTVISGVLENLPGYAQFCAYIDFNDSGIQIVEEPTEKKNKRKWTAQEILSKCQSNHQGVSNNNNHEVVQQK